MGGFHIKYRRSNKRYIAVSSTLKLPTALDSDNTDKAEVIPEFFHGFYYGSHGIDTGLMYKFGKFTLCSWSFLATAEDQDPDKRWKEEPLWTPINKGDTVVLNSYLSNNALVTDCLKNGVKVGSISTTLYPDAYRLYSTSGALINREIVMAANTNQYAPTPAYFSDAKFYNTTLTTTSWSYEALSASNSWLKQPYSDSSPIPSKFRYGGYSGTEGNFVFDVASADCR